MNLLSEIRKQPEHIRHIMMWLCVMIVFSLTGFVWFKSTQQKFVAMLHPEEFKQLTEQKRLAQDGKESPLADLWDSFSVLRASIGELIQGEVADLVKEKKAVLPKPILPRALPLSEDK